MRTLGTAITAVCSSRFTPGGQSAARRSRILRRRVSSYTGPGSSTGATATHGVSGELRLLAACGDPKPDAEWIRGVNRLADIFEASAWDLANRKALGQ
jgi:hypothetical protein